MFFKKWKKTEKKKENGEYEILIKETMPQSITDFLMKKKVSMDKIDVSISSDIDENRYFGKQWLIVDRAHLYILSDTHNGYPQELFTFNLSEVKEVKSYSVISGQIMEVNVNGNYFEVLRYSNAVTDKFALAIKIINDKIRHPDLSSEMLKEFIKVEEERIKESRRLDLPLQETRKAASRLFQMSKPYSGSCIVMFILLLIGVTIDLTPPYLIRTLVDDVLGPKAMHPEWLLILVLGLLGIQVARIFITVINNRINAVVGNRFVFDLRARLFEKLQELSVDFFDRKQVGGLMSRISNDTEVLQSFISNISQGFLLNIVMILGIGAVLFSMNWRLGLFVIIPGPLVMIATQRYWKYIMRFYNRYWISRWRINSFLNTSLAGVRVVKAFAQEQKEIDKFEERNIQLMGDGLAINRSWMTFFPIISFLFGVGSLMVWYIGGRFVLSNDPQYHISLGTLIAFLSYLGMFYGPLTALTQISQWATQLLTATHRIFEIFEEKEETVQVKNVISLDEVKGKIEFRNVFFGYIRYLPVLWDISFTIEPGEIVGIIGPSGSGKTTIVNLLCRFYEASDGQVLIDDIDIRLLDKIMLRKQIGLVLQEPYLFRGSITENIAYAKPDAGMEEIIYSAKMSNAHDFIVRLPDGYETRIGERGVGLSGGERQRISIARAILRNPKILIMDEATTSVDAEAENLIQQALNTLIKNRTTFIIAHRLSTLQQTDKVIVIRNGILKEFGRRQDLIKQNGYYRKFVKMQSSTFGKLRSEYE